jgi:hypothetical protein
MSEIIENPFYVDSTVESNINDIREELKISKYLVICWKGDPDDNIYEERLTRDKLDNLLRKLVMMKGDKSILEKSISQRLLIRTKIVLRSQLQLDPSIILDTDDEVKVVISIFLDESRDLVEDIFKDITHDESIAYILIKIEGIIDMGLSAKDTLKKLKVILYTLKDHDYWSVFDNCKRNHTIPFIRRKFDYKIIKKDLNNKTSYQSLNSKQDKESDYLGEVIRNITEKERPKNTDRESYVFGEGPDYKNHELILTRILERCYRFGLSYCADLIISFLLKTKHYWQLYLKSIKVKECSIELMKDFPDKYNYVMYYPMRTIYLEEYYTKHNFMNRYKKCVFTLEQALTLPINERCTEANPYFPLTVSHGTNKMDLTKNLFGPMAIDQKFRGFSDMKIFKRNLAIFNPIKRDNIDDPSNGGKSIFDDIEFKEVCYKCDGNIDCYLCKGTGYFDRFCLVGSMMAFATPKGHPHLSMFPGERDEKMWRMMKEYYNDSDQDVMVYAENQDDFKNVVDKTIIPGVLKNLKIGNLDMKDDDLEIKQTKDFTIIIDRKFLEIVCTLKIHTKLFEEYQREAINLKQEDYTPDNIKKNIGDLWVKIFIHKMTKMYATEVPEYFKTNNLEKIKIMVKIAWVRKDVKPEPYLCKVLKRIKYIVDSKYMERKLEIFKVQTPYFMNTISVFHLPCVRAFYNGQTIYMMPSFIFACMTRMNIDYKYFTSNTHPIEIILKYLQRGFGTILNKVEKAQVVEYIKRTPKWKTLLNDNPQNVMYRMNYSSLFLKPRQVLNNDEVKYLPNPNDSYISYSLPPDYQNNKMLKIINKDGFMKPFDNMMVVNYDRWKRQVF